MQRLASAKVEEMPVPVWFDASACRWSARRSAGREEVAARLGRPSAGGRRTAGLARGSLRPRPVWAARPLAASAPAGWRGRALFVHGSSSAKVLVRSRAEVAPGRRQVVSVAAVQQRCMGRGQQWVSSPALRSTAAPERRVGLAPASPVPASIGPLWLRCVAKGCLTPHAGPSPTAAA